MHHPTDRIIHTTAFVTPVVEHWLEREIAQWVHPMKDRSDVSCSQQSRFLLLDLWMNVFTFSAKNSIVDNSLRILDLCRTPETDSTNPRGSIEPRLRTTGLDFLGSI